MKNLRALSIRQPHAENILRGKKKIEYRSRPTNVRERVYIYASNNPAHEIHWKKIKMKPGDLPTGILVGTVEIIGCKEKEGEYHWKLANPKRMAKKLKPKKKPQPVWFYPF